MTRRERVERAIACEPTDRVPVFDKIRNDAAIGYYSGRRLRIDNGFETVCRAMDRVLDLFQQREGARAHAALGRRGRTGTSILPLDVVDRGA